MRAFSKIYRGISIISFPILILFGGCDRVKEIPDVLLAPDVSNRPMVVDSSPSPLNSSVSADTKIWIEFNQDMDQESIRESFSISGSSSVSGTPRWEGRRMYYDLAENLTPGASYVLNLGANSTSEDSIKLEVPYIVHFVVGSRIDAPEVTRVFPSDNSQSVGQSANIELEFSRSMDRASTEAAFSISPNLDGDFSWNAGSTVLTFNPHDTFTYASTYSISLGTSAKDGEGIKTAATFSSSFQVGSDFQSPEVLTIEESGNLTPLLNNFANFVKDSSIIITFSENMDSESVRKNILLTRVEGNLNTALVDPPVWTGFSEITIKPAAPLEPEHEYRLEIQSGAKDAAGNGITPLVLYFTVNNAVSPITNNSNYMSITNIAYKNSTSSTFVDVVLGPAIPHIDITDSGISSALSVNGQIRITFSHDINLSSIPGNISINKVRRSHPGTGAIEGISGLLGSNVLLVDLSDMGSNIFEFHITGGRNGVLSKSDASETSTWNQDSMYFVLDLSE